MSKHLILTAGGEGWRLPADTDLAELESRIAQSMLDGSVARITVETQDNPLTTGIVLLNGRGTATAAIIELPET